MYTIDVKDYPVDKEWNEKINSAPNIPGGKDMLMQNLRQLLLLVDQGAGFDDIPPLPGSKSGNTLRDLCVHRLSPMDLVVRDADGKWVLSDESRLWLDCEDPLYLAAYFSAHIKFFAEILYYLDSPKTSRELFDIAVNDYDLAWKITTTINSRLIWLRQFGLIEFREFSLLYYITDLGRDFLKTVHPVLPMDTIKSEDKTDEESDFRFDDRIMSYFYSCKKGDRKAVIGYFPQHISKFRETLSEFLTQIITDNHIDSICSFAKERYHIKDSSVRSALTTASALGVIERKTNTTYEVTDIGMVWTEYRDTLSLLPLFQLKYYFVMELLYELRERCLSVKELATIAKVSYGFDKENIIEINKRIELLKSADLIINVSAQKYSLTHRGELLLDRYGKDFQLKTPLITASEVPSSLSADVISRLRLAAKDSYNSDKFEKLTAEYFSVLGFDAEWVGGSGKTDVLLKTGSTPQDTFVVTVDAKTTHSDTVTDGQVDFDTLKEHQAKHSSDHIAIVGRSFNNRLINRAIEHRVTLFDLDTLEKLYYLHLKTPLKTTAYKKIFEQDGIPDLSVLDAEIRKKEETGNLLKEVMMILVAESHDEITHGYLTVRDIYRSLRDSKSNSSALSIGSLEAVLDFLSSPLIDCVKCEKLSFHASGSLQDLSNTLNYLKSKAL